jgi:diguanylate cyclase (GGDEF)-like protein
MVTRFVDKTVAVLRRMTIKVRLTLALVLSVFPLLISGYVSYAESSRAIERKAQRYALEIVKQVAKNAQLRMAQINTDAETLVLSERVQSAFAQNVNPSASNAAQAQSTMPGILLDAFGSFGHVNQMYFLSSTHQILDAQVFSQLGQKIGAFTQQARYDKDQAYWETVTLRSDEPGIAMVRQVFLKANNQLAGYLYLGIKPSHFSEIFENIALGSESDIYVVDAHSASIIVQSSVRMSRMDSAARNDQLGPALTQAIKDGQTSGSVRYAQTEPGGAGSAGAGDVVAVFAAIPNTDWFVVNAVPHHSLVEEARTVRNSIAAFSVVVMVAALALAYVLGRSIAEPLQQLMQQIQDADAGHVIAPLQDGGHDELTVLSRKFSDLTLKVRYDHELLEERVLSRTAELEQANLKLAALSTTDGLTGIANRRRFDDALANEWRRAARLRQPLALAMVDIDWFKDYNDHYGHPAGDECLRQVAALLGQCVARPGDLVARYGGEEFVFVAPMTDGASAYRIAQKFCDALQALALPHATSSFNCVTVSVGVAAIVPQDDSASDTLVAVADRALYRAKGSGRNQVVLA